MTNVAAQREMVYEIATAIAGRPDQVCVTTSGAIIKLKVGPSDVGRMLGARAATFNSIRILVEESGSGHLFSRLDHDVGPVAPPRPVTMINAWDREVTKSALKAISVATKTEIEVTELNDKALSLVVNTPKSWRFIEALSKVMEVIGMSVGVPITVQQRDASRSNRG